jgi:hypothetical protein
MASVKCGISASASSTPRPRRSSRAAASRRSSASGHGSAVLRPVPRRSLRSGEFLEFDIGDFFQLAEAFGDQQLRQRLVDIEFVLEHLRTLDEFLLALLAGVGLGHDVDRLAGQLAGEADVLAATADGEAKLIVGHHHFDATFFLVDDDAADRCGLQRVDDERRGVLATRG